MKLADVIAEMKVTLGSPIQPVQKSEKILEGANEFLIQALARDPERGQTAVLMVIPDHQQLTFIYPQHLARGNVLPIDRDSFAGRAVLEKKALVENRMPEEPHKDFFERIPASGRAARPIQKMIAAPMLNAQGEALGVIEVSRTGSSPSAAADFAIADARNLEICCRAFAPFIVRTWNR